MRLIDADALKEALQNRNECKNCTDIDCAHCFYDLIDNVPTVAYPFEKIRTMLCRTCQAYMKMTEPDRPQGEWVDDKEYPYLANCSNCGYQMDTHDEHGYFKFCPNCGTQMKHD